MLDFEEKKALFLGKFGIFTYPLKFYVWGRKIEENVEFLKYNRKKEIKPYLEKCYFYRKKYLKEPLTFIEIAYQKKVVNLLKKFEILE